MEDQHGPTSPDSTMQSSQARDHRPPRREPRQRQPEHGGGDESNPGGGQSHARPGKRGGAGGPQHENRDNRKRRKDGGERRPAMAFGDGIERAVCTAYRRWEPDGFPIQHRTGLATRRISEVDRRAEATLFCDGAHPGPHIWPDGELVDDDMEVPIVAGSARSEDAPHSDSGIVETVDSSERTEPSDYDLESHADNGTTDDYLEDDTHPGPAASSNSDDDLLS